MFIVKILFQVSQDLLLENQYEYFIELIKDIVRQLRLNPNQLPTPQAPRRNLDKVSAAGRCAGGKDRLLRLLVLKYINIHR